MAQKRHWKHAIVQAACATLLNIALGSNGRAIADDWPTLRHDERRSSVSSDQLPLASFALDWHTQVRQSPRPAWPGPARWDAYVKRARISSMRNYDESFHLTIAKGKLYFGSSADDALHCLDAGSGNEMWTFTTGGPVRLPPTIHKDRLYFGSDDGHAYCLSADGTKQFWKSRPAPARLVVCDGRLISQWPVRSGVLVKDDIAYFGASLVPWQKSYLCALDAHDGSTNKASCYIREIDQATLEGSLLADQDQLLLTQGRASPLWFTRSTGQSRGKVAGANGGSFALIGADGTGFFGPGSHEGFLSEANPVRSAVIARKFGAVALVAHEGLLYDIEPRTLGCLRQKGEAWVWRRPSDLEECLILAGEHLIAGGNGRVVAFLAKNGEPVWEAPVQGRAQCLAVADETLFVSTDEGHLYAFRGNQNRAATPAAANQIRFAPQPPQEPLPTTRVPATIRRGPIVRFTTPDSATITWETELPSETALVYGIDGYDTRLHNASPTTRHLAELTRLRPRTVYRFAIHSADSLEGTVAGPFECDTHLNFTLPPAEPTPASVAPKPQGQESLASRLLSHLEREAGIGVIVGTESLPLALEMARASSFHVVVFETDAKRIQSAREQLKPTGLYGTRISVLEVRDYANLPVTSSFANLVVLTADLSDATAPQIAEATRLICPQNGRLLVLPVNADQPIATDTLRKFMPADAHPLGDWNDGVLISKSLPTGIGEWTHQYGGADNATFAGETLSGAKRTTDFEVQWIGKPGPRFQSDRGNRKPAPLSGNGRLFVQGLDRVMALDAYNGAILWNLEIPDSRRFNIRNDSANWCVDSQHVYLSVRDACWAIDARDGQLAKEFRLPSPEASGDWGYVGRQANMLVGSRVRSGSAFQEFWGGQYWYTDPEGPLAAKVCSDQLFAYDIHQEKPRWQYEGGLIVNTSIAMQGDTVFFVESKSRELLVSNPGRVTDARFWDDLELVALSLTDGKELWRRPLKAGLGTTMFSLACAGDRVVTVASAKGNYRVHVFRQSDGEPEWETTFPWEAVGKGGDSARPAIIGDRLYISPQVFELATGKVLPQKLTRGACGSYAAASHVFITRLGNLGLWDPESNKATTWERLRPDCWLSAIPAGGLILAPEGGGGCSCGGWIETSIAFTPDRGK